MSGAFSHAGVGVVLAAMLGLSGCGQKGPLYLPEKSGAVVTAPATTAPAPPPPATTPGQPPQPSPAPQPQSAGEPPPTDITTPPKKPDKDEDQQTPH
jgi:predicted small lipoprotein YifL